MKLSQNFLFALLLAQLVLFAPHSQGLSIEDFNKICDSAPMPCTEIPILQAYVGGSLDLLAMLDEETDYLDTLYCVPKRQFLDTTSIIDYMVEHKEDRPKRNAMMLLIQYLEEKGGC